MWIPTTAPPPPKQHLASTQDLISRFRLLPAYDKYVRPFAPVVSGTGAVGNQGATPNEHLGHTASSLGPGAVNSPGVLGVGSPAAGMLDKGKGREVPLGMGMGMGMGGMPGTAPPAGTGGDVDQLGKDDGGDGDDDDGPGGKGEKKKKNSYKHLIKGIPGKHSLKKDDYLTTMMLVPPKQRVRITHFDAKTQQEAFNVTLEGLKGVRPHFLSCWNINALVLESAQAREDRKKRKELKKLAKLQAQGVLPPGTAIPTGGASTSTPTSTAPPLSALHPATTAGTPLASARSRTSTPLPQSAQSTAGNSTIQAPIPTPAGAGSAKRTTTSTPRPGSSAAGTASTPRPASTVPRPGSTVPRPGSAVPRPGSATAQARQQQQQQLGQGQAGQQQQSRPQTVSQPQPQKPTIAGQYQSPLRAGTPMEVDMPLQRGKKRDREDAPAVNGVNGHGGAGYAGAGTNGNGTYTNGAAQQVRVGVPVNGGHPSVMANANAKAGTGGVRPRPIKKQRMDVQGQSRDVSGPVQQQPTPQGV
ncbi:hypothetical protein CVT24_000751 [Panaeolus cyanescens]|uniref:Uncharacterized protein n=1 Tax=Panaeolus cyanescens TaxID=181874 RepID=A0A409YCP9_9AGAR|nr:hypothetical protein CVT24_000751 [Panaeolus cyanescens]